MRREMWVLVARLSGVQYAVFAWIFAFDGATGKSVSLAVAGALCLTLGDHWP